MRTRLLLMTAALLSAAACAPRGDDEAADVSGDPRELLAPPELGGIVYVSHYATEELRIYRMDGSEPAAAPPFELGKLTHDLALDPYAGLLAVVSDVAGTVDLLRVFRPESGAAPVPPPEPLSAVAFEDPDRPLFARFDPAGKRLYVVSSGPGSGPGAPYLLHAFDISSPQDPAPVSGFPLEVPVTTSWDLDPVRELLFLVATADDTLHVFDLHDDRLEPLPGGPIPLRESYPEESSVAFTARRLTVDARRNRIYAARSQSALSELIAIEYPADLTPPDVAYSEVAGTHDFVVVPDAFDAALPPEARPNLLDAYVAAVDGASGAVFLSAAGWNGSGSTALVTAFAPDTLALGAGCEELEGFGCFYRTHIGGTAGSYRRTDGAACVDPARGVFVGTSVDDADEANPGQLHVFRYDASLGMTPWLPAGGGTLTAGGLPISAVCH